MRDRSAGNTQFTSRLNRIREAYKTRDVAVYRTIVKALLEEARSLDSAALIAKLAEIERIRKETSSDTSFDGLEPVIFGYLKRIAHAADQVDAVDKVDERKLLQLQEEPLLKMRSSRDHLF